MIGKREATKTKASDAIPASLSLVNITTGKTLAARATLAATPLGRLLGGLGGIAPGSALGITRCDWIHTVGMRMPIDAAYCDAGGKTLRVVANLPAGRIGPCVPGGSVVWEAGAGALAPFVTDGDLLALVAVPKD